MRLLPGEHTVHRLPPESELPALEPSAGVVATVRRASELSVVCPSGLLPAEGTRSEGWVVLEVAGPLDLSLTGIAARLTAPLARADVPVFVISSYDTDLVLVPALVEADVVVEDAVVEGIFREDTFVEDTAVEDASAHDGC